LLAEESVVGKRHVTSRHVSLFGIPGISEHLSNHVVQNAAVTEVDQFHFGVESHDDVESSTVAHL
jgi:hypothetical protein